jgi:hypothetical protein
MPTSQLIEAVIDFEGPRWSVGNAAKHVRRFCFINGLEIVAEEVQKSLFDAYYGFRLQGEELLIDELRNDLVAFNSQF